MPVRFLLNFFDEEVYILQVQGHKGEGGGDKCQKKVTPDIYNLVKLRLKLFYLD